MTTSQRRKERYALNKLLLSILMMTVLFLLIFTGKKPTDHKLRFTTSDRISVRDDRLVKLTFEERDE